MSTLLFKNTHFLTLLLLISCANSKGGKDAFAKAEKIQPHATSKIAIADKNRVTQAKIDSLKTFIVGANQTAAYLPLLQGKRVGVVTNQSGLIFTSYPHSKQHSTHLVDSLLSLQIDIKKVYSPEHGFRGDIDAGKKVKDGKDPTTGLPIISLYGESRKPSPEHLQDIDILLFDIQDVGVRFYTYISTLTYVMEAAAQKGVPLVLLDRPNPNAHYIDGPTLEKEHQSFLGMHEIPLVYGMTIGEYAQMVNGEKWMENDVETDLTIIPLKNWSYKDTYTLPTRPSPNLPNSQSINLYPSLGFFEGTTVNAGRGTEMQFQIFGAPDFDSKLYSFSYTPKSNFGARNPKHKGNLCHGVDLREEPYMERVSLEWLIEAYNATPNKENFFKSASFTLHAGTKKIEQQIKEGYTFKEIKTDWIEGIERFKHIRKKYLLYE